MDVGLEGEQNLFHVGFTEDNDVIDALESGQDLGPFPLGEEGASGSLEGAHGRVAVQGHDQDVPLIGGFAEVPDVPHMEKVETTVGQHDPPAAALLGLDGLPQFG